MEQRYRAIGGHLVQPALSGTYAAGPLLCFLYDTRERELGLSLCFDGEGHLAETVDARSGTTSWNSLRFEPSLARFRVDPAEIRRASEFLAERLAYRGAEEVSNLVIDACGGGMRELVTAFADTGNHADLKRALLDTGNHADLERALLEGGRHACRSSAQTQEALRRAVLQKRYPTLATVVRKYVAASTSAVAAAEAIERLLAPGSTASQSERLHAATQAAEQVTAAATALKQEMARLTALYAPGRSG